MFYIIYSLWNTVQDIFIVHINNQNFSRCFSSFLLDFKLIKKNYFTGQYSLVEPDGSVRTVDYTADSVNGKSTFRLHTEHKTKNFVLNRLQCSCFQERSNCPRTCCPRCPSSTCRSNCETYCASSTKSCVCIPSTNR